MRRPLARARVRVKVIALVAPAIAGLLAVVAPAAAQSPDPTPVVGGGSFNTAARVEPGVYRDTLLPNENLFYAIALQPGQTLKATFDLDGVDARTLDLSSVSVLRVQLHGPLRDADPRLTGFATTMSMLPIEATSGPAQTLAGSVGAQYFTGPGRWYVSVSAGARDDARIELPFVLRLERTGEVVGEPRTARTTAAAPAATTPTVGGDGLDDVVDFDVAVVVGVAAVGLALGLGLALLLTRRRP